MNGSQNKKMTAWAAMFLLPLVLQAIALLLVYFSSDGFIEWALKGLGASHLTWPSIHRIAEAFGDRWHNRFLLCVIVGGLIAVLSTVYFVVALFLFGDARRSGSVSGRGTLIAMAFSSIFVTLIFIIPESYVPREGARFVAIPPDLFGLFVLIIFWYGFSFFMILPIVAAMYAARRAISVIHDMFSYRSH